LRRLRIAEVVMRLGEVRFEGQRAAIVRHRLIRFRLIQKRNAKVVVGLGEVRLKDQGLLILVHRCVQLPFRPPHNPLQTNAR
jgi:hypothetical protein